MRICSRRWITAAALLVATTAGSLHAQPTTAFEPGQSVEVREGNTWSKAKVLATEGRRYQIQYDDGTEEWVTADRLRAGNAAAAGASTKPASPKPAAWQTGQDVDVKWGGLWRKGRVINRRGEWLMIEYAQGKTIEWVEPWRIRKIGSTEDVPYATPNGFAKKTDAPPRPKPGAAPEMDKPGGGGADPFAPQAFDLPVTPIEMKGVKQITAGATGWSYKPTAAEPMKPLARPIATQGPAHVGAAPVAIDVAGGKAMIGYVLGSGHGKGTSVETIDLASGKASQLTLNSATRPLALMPDGKRILARAEGFFPGTKHRLDVWDVSGGEAKHAVSFIPYPSKDGKAGDIEAAFVVDDEHVITSSGSALTCWKLAEARAIWNFDAKGTYITAAQSPDGKTLAAAAAGNVQLIDAATGDLLGYVTGGSHARGVAFSPSGKRLFAATFGGGVTPIDLATGDAKPIVAVSGATAMRPLSDRLVDLGVAVVDVERPALVAKVNSAGGGQTEVAAGSLFTLAREGTSATLSATKLPPAELERLADAAKTGDAVQLTDGTSVSLDVSLPVDAAQSEAIVRDLRARLEKSGLQVSDGAPVRIVARVEDGKTEERMYESRFSRDQERQKVTVTEKVTRLWIESNGKNVWEVRQSVWPSTFIDRKEGQSIDEAVQQSNKPSVDFLRNVTLPRTILTDDPSKLPTVKLVPAAKK